MAQMPIQQLAGRANLAFAPTSPPSATKAGFTLPRASYLLDPGGIPGGLLRPGAMDQAQFKAQLAAAQKQSLAAPPALLRTPSAPGIINLSPAQLAALGAIEAPAKAETVIDIPAPNPGDSGQGAGQGAGQSGQPYVFRPVQGQPLNGQPGGIEGATGAVTAPLFQAAPAAPASAIPSDGSATGVPEAAPIAAPAPAAPAAPPAQQATAERAPIPRSHRGADGVWELPRLPDKDEREMLRGQKWRVVENEESRKLFLGPDGKFGWDDFVDLINPLQHIPLVNMVYRAITGDEIYGAARMVDAAFGPLAGVSTAVDLAFKSTTGKGMADNAIAALFGSGGDAAGAVATVNTASADATQLADAGAIRRGSNK